MRTVEKEKRREREGERGRGRERERERDVETVACLQASTFLRGTRYI